MTELTLTDRESRRLKSLEATISKSAGDMYDAMRAIHDEKLYRAEFETWEEYCDKRWGMSKRHADRLLEHGRILALLSDDDIVKKTGPMGPVSERATRELAGLPDEAKVKVITEVASESTSESTAETNGKPRVTAAKVRRKVKSLSEPLPDELAEDVREAISSGKLQATESQIAALAEYTQTSQSDLVQSVLAGRQSLEKAIETGEVPEPTVEEVMSGVNSAIESFCRRLVKTFEDDCPDDAWLQDLHRRDAALQKVKDACSTLRTAKCSHACPMCSGEGCQKCRNTGRVPKAVYDQMQ